MKLLLSTTDPTVIAFAQVLLAGEDIDSFVMDVHISAMQVGFGLFPQRLMVADRDHFRAQAVLTDNEIADLQP